MNAETASAIQAVASVINLLFVVFVFWRERSDDRKGQKMEKKEFWYRETMLSRGVDTLNGCFCELERILQQANGFNEHRSEENEQNVRRLVGEARNQIGVLKRNVLIYTKLFDAGFARDMKIITNRLEDGISEGLESCYFSGTGTTTLNTDLDKYKYEIISKLYKFDTGDT